MPFVLVRHRVADYQRWREEFDRAISLRVNGGEKGARVLQEYTDPNLVYLLLEYDSVDRAEKFFASKAARDKLAEAGVVEEPTIVPLRLMP